MTVTITHAATGLRATRPDGRRCEDSLLEVRTWTRRRTPANGTVIITEAVAG